MRKNRSNRPRPDKTRGRQMVFIASSVRREVKDELTSWAAAEDRTLSNLITRLIRADLEKSGYYPSEDRENEPERKRWPNITLEPPVRMTML